MRIDLVIIDGQNDFLTDGTESWNLEKKQGSLCVVGASQEALLLSDMIKRLRNQITMIRITLDSHHRNDGMHNISWKKPNGAVCDPFTIVTHQMVKNQDVIPVIQTGRWEGKQVSSYEWALKYTKALEDRGRNPLCLWPVHCQIGTWGSNIYPPLQAAYDEWCDAHHGWVDPVTKGSWPWTEHYSAVQSDVPDPTVPETGMNTRLIEDAFKADMIVLCGWAGSHCTKWTGIDAVNEFGEDPPGSNSNEFVRKLVILEDCCAAVGDLPGSTMFADSRKQWLDEMKQRGATITTSEKFLS